MGILQPLCGLSQSGGQHKSESKEVMLHVGCCIAGPRCPQIYTFTYQMCYGMHRIMEALPKAQTRLCACPQAQSEVYRLAQEKCSLCAIETFWV